MIISFSTGKVETKGGSGLLQQKRVEVTGNGLDVVVPDAGYDGLSTVYIKTDVGEGGSDYKDFTVMGYDDMTSIALNIEIDDDIAYSKSLYDAWNPENTSTRELYKNNTNLVYAPAIDTSNVVDADSMYYECSKLKYVPQLNLAKVTNMYGMFLGCRGLTSLDLSNWNVSDVISMTHMFSNSRNLTSLNLSNWNVSNVNNMNYTFYNCVNLTSLDLSGWDISNPKNQCSSTFLYCNSLVNLQFGYNIKCSFSLSSSTDLTVESLLSVLNGLYDFTGNQQTPTSYQGKLTLGSTNLAKLTDEQKAIATGKGWVLS